MRLMRIGSAGRERPAVGIGERHYVDISAYVDDFNGAFFADPDNLERVRAVLDTLALEPQPLAGVRVGSPVARPQQILCVGLNYADHARETGQAIPVEPIIFNKAPNTLVGPNDDVQIPRRSNKTDWEVELSLVVGKRASYVETVEAAEHHIAGYMVVNDVSEREFQLERGGQWVKGKSAPTFNPAGPYLLTSDEVPDPLNLQMWLDVDGRRMQTGSTSNMIFSPAHIVHHLSQFMTLEPGDIINTGTPPGVGMGLQPQVFLHGGERITLGIESLGTQTQRVIPPQPATTV
ncbi:MAG: fumarylacetoacetate hydrolase family protein [Thermomicrobiales bacterium]